MIYLNFALRWPKKKTSRGWTDSCIFLKSWKVTANKSIEIQINKEDWHDLVSFCFDYRKYQDHAGLYLSFGLLGWEIIYNWYDNRHWFHREGRWMTDEEMINDVADN